MHKANGTDLQIQAQKRYFSLNIKEKGTKKGEKLF